MLGYSDSGKDAGRAAAAWALYKCQEELVQVCHSLCLFSLSFGATGSASPDPLPAAYTALDVFLLSC